MAWFKRPLEKTHLRLKQCLNEMVDIESMIIEDGSYRLVRGSAVLYLSIKSFGARDVLVSCTSYVVIGAEIDPPLMAFLLESNSKVTFGSFAIDDDQDILFDYSFIATHATQYELREAIKAVSKAVDDYDNKIINRWGGETGYKVLFGVDFD